MTVAIHPCAIWRKGHPSCEGAGSRGEEGGVQLRVQIGVTLRNELLTVLRYRDRTMHRF